MLLFLAGQLCHIIRAPMSYCNVILPCSSSWQGSCIIRARCYISMSYCLAPLPGRAVVSYHKGTYVIFQCHIAVLLFLAGRLCHIINTPMSYFNVILPCSSSWQGGCVIFQCHIAVLLFLAGRLCHIINTPMSYFNVILPCSSSWQGGCVMS